MIQRFYDIFLDGGLFASYLLNLLKIDLLKVRAFHSWVLNSNGKEEVF
jgi:hypothetical protein